MLRLFQCSIYGRTVSATTGLPRDVATTKVETPSKDREKTSFMMMMCVYRPVDTTQKGIQRKNIIIRERPRRRECISSAFATYRFSISQQQLRDYGRISLLFLSRQHFGERYLPRRASFDRGKSLAMPVPSTRCRGEISHSGWIKKGEKSARTFGVYLSVRSSGHVRKLVLTGPYGTLSTTCPESFRKVDSQLSCSVGHVGDRHSSRRSFIINPN